MAEVEVRPLPLPERLGWTPTTRYGIYCEGRWLSSLVTGPGMIVWCDSSSYALSWGSMTEASLFMFGCGIGPAQGRLF